MALDKTATAAAEPAKVVDKVTPEGTVWLQIQAGIFHVQIGSATHERLMEEGAIVVPAPANALPCK